MIKLATFVYPLAVVLMFSAVGCQGNKKPDTAPTASLDKLAPTPDMQSAYNASYAPAPAAPAVYTPAPIETATPLALSDSSAATSATRYTIKPHDTLFSIAAAHYGSGGKWKTIAAANPNLNPKALKVGQTITLP